MVLAGVVRGRGADGGQRDVAARAVPIEMSCWERGAAFHGVCGGFRQLGSRSHARGKPWGGAAGAVSAEKGWRWDSV